MLILRENHRSEPTLFDFISTLPPQLPDAIAAARQRFPPQAREPEHNLCLSHRRRCEINARLNCPRPGSVFVKAPPPEARRANHPQDMHLYAGLELLGCCAKKGILHNGGRYIVEDVSEKVRLSSKDGEELCLTKEEVVRDLRLSHAQTYHSAQGSTLEGRVRLWDCDHPRFTSRHLYVGVSRATSGALVEVM